MNIDRCITFLPNFSGSSKIFKFDIREMNLFHIDACMTGLGHLKKQGVRNSCHDLIFRPA